MSSVIDRKTTVNIWLREEQDTFTIKMIKEPSGIRQNSFKEKKRRDDITESHPETEESRPLNGLVHLNAKHEGDANGVEWTAKTKTETRQSHLCRYLMM